MSGNIYNIYCDETRVDNPDSKRMVIGALIIPRDQKRRIERDIKRIYLRHGFTYELKWTKVNHLYQELYSDLIRYFLSEKNMSFRCIVVDKSRFNLEKFHDGDPELAFYKFYYLMLRPTLFAGSKYYMLLDKKPTSNRNRTGALHRFLQMYASHMADCTIRHFQAYDSQDNVLIQLADFFTGLVGYDVNDEREGVAKGVITQLMKKVSGRATFQTSSTLREEKLNIFVWEPRSCQE